MLCQPPTFQITKILYPLDFQRVNLQEFQLNSIVQFQQKPFYGIVTQINESERPITITWDNELDEPFAYTWDEIRVHQIRIVLPYLPQQTLVKLPLGTTVQLSNGDNLVFNEDTTFLVDSIDSEKIVLTQNSDSYQFPLTQFPGKSFSNLVQIPQNPVQAQYISLNQLKAKAKVWLFLHTPHSFLEIINTAWKKQLETQFIFQLKERYEKKDLEIAWEIAWNEYLETLTYQEGLFGFHVGVKVIDLHTSQVVGEVTAIHWQHSRPINIIRVTGKTLSYSITELRSLDIIPMPPLMQLSGNVAYQMSADGRYYQVFIGFRTKKLAQAWLKPLKKRIGRLSSLHRYEWEELRHLPNKEWEYSLLTPKHKTLKKRREVLQKLVELNLEKLPNKSQQELNK